MSGFYKVRNDGKIIPSDEYWNMMGLFGEAFADPYTPIQGDVDIHKNVLVPLDPVDTRPAGFTFNYTYAYIAAAIIVGYLLLRKKK